MIMYRPYCNPDQKFGLLVFGVSLCICFLPMEYKLYILYMGGHHFPARRGPNSMNGNSSHRLTLLTLPVIDVLSHTNWTTNIHVDVVVDGNPATSTTTTTTTTSYHYHHRGPLLWGYTILRFSGYFFCHEDIQPLAASSTVSFDGEDG